HCNQQAERRRHDREGHAHSQEAREAAFDLHPEHHARETKHGQHDHHGDYARARPPAADDRVARERRRLQPLPEPAAPLIQHHHASIDPHEEDELYAHPGEGVRHAVVLHSLASRDRLQAHRVRHAEAGVRLRPWIGVLPLVPLSHSFEHAAQRGLVRRFHALGLVQVAQGVVQQALRARATQRFPADHFHDVLHQDAAHHLHFTPSAAYAASAAITLRETSLLSRSTTATAIFDAGRSSATPPKIYPKKDAITMGATKLIVTARLS